MGFVMKYKMKGFENELATLISVVDIGNVKKKKNVNYVNLIMLVLNMSLNY